MISPERVVCRIFPDKTQHSAACFLIGTVIAQCPYQIDRAYSDNGTEFKGTSDHAFITACRQHSIGQKFTPINRSQTNGKAKRVIRTLIGHGHRQISFKNSADRRIQLVRFINFYNTVKPHKGLNDATPYEILAAYFNPPLCKQP
ncbi:MAG: integrase core domain-containing protein [Nitrosomonas sp.]|nr:integrase core domain-containing protein [Nitrosomonas sp.]